MPGVDRKLSVLATLSWAQSRHNDEEMDAITLSSLERTKRFVSFSYVALSRVNEASCSPLASLIAKDNQSSFPSSRPKETVQATPPPVSAPPPTESNEASSSGISTSGSTSKEGIGAPASVAVSPPSLFLLPTPPSLLLRRSKGTKLLQPSS